MTELDRLILAPVREELDRLAPMALPVMIMGSPGTGRSRAAQYLHRASGMPGSDVRHVFAAQVDLDFCAEIARRGKGGRRGAAGETIVIDAAEKIPIEVQPHLARSIEAGMAVGGPRILALVGYDPVADPADRPLLSAELWYALSALTIRMPPLAERKGDRAAIAQAFAPVLAARMGLHPPQLDASAADAIERADWPGNFRQMRSVLCAVLAARRDDQPVSGAGIEAQLFRSRPALPHADRGPQGGLDPCSTGCWRRGAFRFRSSSDRPMRLPSTGQAETFPLRRACSASPVRNSPIGSACATAPSAVTPTLVLYVRVFRGCCGRWQNSGSVLRARPL